MSFAFPSQQAGPEARSGWRRALPRRKQLLIVIIASLVGARIVKPIFHNPYIEVAGEVLFVSMVLLFTFTAAGAWRQTAAPRWVVQVLAVAIMAVLSPLMVQMLTFGGDFWAFLESRGHVRGYMIVTLIAIVVGSMFTIVARQSEVAARARALELQSELERETQQRQTSDASLHLLTAQIQPHFLFNTLANIQELVESGSPRAPAVFRSLIEYLRAAMPHLQKQGATLGDEERLVRAYLDLMQMRMPDRLTYSVGIDPALRDMRFPPMALLTLVENAIRHGIDPSVDPGHVDVGAQRIDDRAVHLWVADTGAGLAQDAGWGTGLANLNARLKAFFDPGAVVELSEQVPHGVRADIRLRVPG